MTGAFKKTLLLFFTLKNFYTSRRRCRLINRRGGSRTGRFRETGSLAGALFFCLYENQALRGKSMKMYRIGLCYSGYMWLDVAAKNAYEACGKAERLTQLTGGGPELADLDRWPEADQFEEIEEA
jgi:hypothetical protein